MEGSNRVSISMDRWNKIRESVAFDNWTIITNFKQFKGHSRRKKRGLDNGKEKKYRTHITLIKLGCEENEWQVTGSSKRKAVAQRRAVSVSSFFPQWEVP